MLPDTSDQVLQSPTLSAVTLAAILLALLAFRLPVTPRRGAVATSASSMAAGSRS